MNGEFIPDYTCKRIAMVLLETVISALLSKDLLSHVSDSYFQQVLIVNEIRHNMVVCPPGVLDLFSLSGVHSLIFAHI